MARTVDLQDYLWMRQFRFLRLDGSSHINDRRDMVSDFQRQCVSCPFSLSLCLSHRSCAHACVLVP